MLADGYAALSASAQAMLTASNRLTEREIDRLQHTAAEGRKTWGYLALAAGAIALALAILFAVLIARPIRQLDLAIRQMGTADFTHAIEVNGPQDMRYLGQRLEWLRARLHELEEQQTRFLRHVSHELKTPLTAVREGAELLRDRVGGELSPEQQEIVRIVRENTLNLQKLIEDLLSYHQTRNIEPQTLGPVPLADVIRRVVREHKLAAFARMISFDTRVKPAIVVGDADKIRAIVDNLVSNAIKYSPRSGSVAIDLRIEGGQAVLDVIDQGPGVGSGGSAAHLRVVLPGQAGPRGTHQGLGPGACDRQRVRPGAWRQDRARSIVRRAGAARISAFGCRSRRAIRRRSERRGPSRSRRKVDRRRVCSAGAAAGFALLAACAATPPASPPAALALAPAVPVAHEELPVTPVPVPPVVIVQAPPQSSMQPAATAPALSEEDEQALALLADLQRYAVESSDDLKRELAAANAAVNRTRSDANRIRLAMLLTLPSAGAPDDGRAVSLLEPMVGKGSSSPLKHSPPCSTRRSSSARAASGRSRRRPRRHRISSMRCVRSNAASCWSAAAMPVAAARVVAAERR